MNYKKVGELVGFVGPMFSGKTTALINISKEKENSIILKTSFDNRYHTVKIMTHDKVEMDAVATDSWKPAFEDFDYFFFDEIQFFKAPYFIGDIEAIIDRLLADGKNVYFSGLDMDVYGNVFTQSGLLSKADHLYKLKAKCSVCEKPASKSYRFTEETAQVLLGSSDKYEARCNAHWRHNLDG